MMVTCSYEKCNKQLLGIPFICSYCKQKYCIDHRLAEKHDCIKTRYVKYLRKEWLRRGGARALNITSGSFYVICETCGFTSSPAFIEIVGKELEYHNQSSGCPIDKILLEECSS